MVLRIKLNGKSQNITSRRVAVKMFLMIYLQPFYRRLIRGAQVNVRCLMFDMYLPATEEELWRKWDVGIATMEAILYIKWEDSNLLFIIRTGLLYFL
jgi:hypothetical protein